MAAVGRPKLLASEFVGAGEYSSIFRPNGCSWEVNSIVASGSVTIFRAFDADNDGMLETTIEVESGPAGEFHGYKFQCDERSGIVIRNDSSSTIFVALLGVEIS